MPKVGLGKFRASLAVVSLLFVSSLHAETLTLNAAFRMALDGHPLRQQKLSGIAAAADELKAAEWKRYPTLTGEGTHNVQQSSESIASARTGSTLRLQQPLWTGGRIDAEIGSADLRRKIAEYSLDETDQDLLVRVAQSYSDCLRLAERVGIAQDSVLEHERLYALIDRRLKQQVSSEADVALAHARLLQARSELLTLRATLSNARTTLGQLMGAKADGGLTSPVIAGGPTWDTETVVVAASQYSPFLRRLDTELLLAKSEVASRKSALMPQLSARYEKFGGSAAVLPSDRVMLVVEFQPGAGLSSVSQMDAAIKRVQAAESAIEAGAREVTEKALNQLNERNSFAEQIAPTASYAQATRDVMSSYLRQYTAGRKSWLDVLNTQRELTQARYTAADVGAGVLLSTLKLDVLTGRLTRASVMQGYPAATAH